MKQVAVTGSSRGIGFAIAKRFLSAGWKVFALQRSPAELDTLQSLGNVQHVPFDATDPGSVLLAAQAIGASGPLHALVNNAGIALSQPLAKTTLEDFNKVQAVNVTAPFLLCRELMPAMAQAKAGRVVNIASTAAVKGFKYTSAYVASKHALLGLTRALAVEFATKGVTVNAVCPGWTDTDILAATTARISQTTGRSEEEARAAVMQLTPMGRAVKPEEVAELTFFLCDAPAAGIITGANYLIDGGETV